jgi:hypothetical protein
LLPVVRVVDVYHADDHRVSCGDVTSRTST